MLTPQSAKLLAEIHRLAKKLWEIDARVKACCAELEVSMDDNNLTHEAFV